MPATPDGGHEVVPMTPSEVVLLRADDLIMTEASGRIRGATPLFHGQECLDFVPRGAKFRLAEGRPEIPGEAWALAMLAVAFLAIEREGWLRFEIREKHKWAGLSKDETLVAIAAAGRPSDHRWPDPCLEEQLARRAAGRAVSTGVSEWLEEDTSHPADQALSMGRQNLMLRGLIDEEQVKRFGFLSSLRFTVPAATDRLVPSEDDVLTLVEDCLEKRPEIWSVLNREVQQGIQSRREDPDIG